MKRGPLSLCRYLSESWSVFSETVQLSGRELIATGPRSPRRGAPYTFVTTDQFLVAFDFESLRDLPDREQLEDAGLTE